MVVPETVLARKNAVVCVRARGDSGVVRFSGFLVDSNGLVLTTAHGFTDLRDLRVTFSNGRSVQATVFRRDTRRDLLLLETRTDGAPALSLGDGRSGVTPGEAVFTVGCPGNVIGVLHGGVADGPARHLEGLPLVPIRMEIRRGSSGSPVFDAEGRLLGMIKGRFRGTATVGFLIPLDTMMDFLRKPSP
jgi:serine protease Do